MNKRQSNFELLRIISMMLIIMFHYVYKGDFFYPEEFTLNKLVLKTIWFFGELGVNLFVLITGYFQVNGNFKTKKFVSLLAEVLFYHIGSLIFLSMIGDYSFPAENRDRLLLFFPISQNYYWFATAYVLLYILSPYINLLIKAMGQQEHRKLLLILLTIFCFIPTVLGVFYNNTEKFLYYNRFIWLIVVYLAGAYIRLYPCKFLDKPQNTAFLSIAVFCFMVSSIWVIDNFPYLRYLGIQDAAYFCLPNTLPMFLLSIAVFCLFRKLQLPHLPFVNRLASTTLGIYLLHDGPALWWLWDQFQNASHQFSPFVVLYILRDALIVFLGASAIDLLRQFLEKYTLQNFLNCTSVSNFLSKFDSTISIKSK